MRITGGKAARRILKVPKGLDVRPTPDLVKQAIFNSLGERVVGAKVLELFAGSGALSLECFESRRGFGDVRGKITSARGIYSQQRSGGGLRRNSGSADAGC